MQFVKTVSSSLRRLHRHCLSRHVPKAPVYLWTINFNIKKHGDALNLENSHAQQLGGLLLSKILSVSHVLSFRVEVLHYCPAWPWISIVKRSPASASPAPETIGVYLWVWWYLSSKKWTIVLIFLWGSMYLPGPILFWHINCTFLEDSGSPVWPFICLFIPLIASECLLSKIVWIIQRCCL